jgi:hypothetical protein
MTCREKTAEVLHTQSGVGIAPLDFGFGMGRVFHSAVWGSEGE